jgi:hypothetical protein
MLFPRDAEHRGFVEPMIRVAIVLGALGNSPNRRDVSGSGDDARTHSWCAVIRQ